LQRRQSAFYPKSANGTRLSRAHERISDSIARMRFAHFKTHHGFERLRLTGFSGDHCMESINHGLRTRRGDDFLSEIEKQLGSPLVDPISELDAISQSGH
jgi:hypothetical protein